MEQIECKKDCQWNHLVLNTQYCFSKYESSKNMPPHCKKYYQDLMKCYNDYEECKDGRKVKIINTITSNIW